MTPLVFVCDDARHLICLPYTVANLHAMARTLGIKRCWFHAHKTHPHYDVPARRVVEVARLCRVVSQRDLLAMTKGAI